MTITAVIEKEQVNDLKMEFVHMDLPESERTIIIKRLFDAMMLGNLDHHKVKIDFMTSEGIKEVETTIWATTDKFIMLKGGRYIPISSILNVV